MKKALRTVGCLSISLLVGLGLFVLCCMIPFIWKQPEGKIPWGRDSVMQFDDGFYQIGRLPDFYDFDSWDHSVHILYVSHYYRDGIILYLLTEDGLYVRVDTENHTVQSHNSIDAFDEDDQRIFTEKRFVDLKNRSIIDIMFR